MGSLGVTLAAPGMTLQTPVPAPKGAASQPPQGLDKHDYFPVVLGEVTSVTHDTSLFTFRWDDTQDVHWPECSHVCVGIPDTRQPGKRRLVIRSYTPIRTGKGWLTLLVKKYSDGVVSSHIFGLQKGAELLMRGPVEGEFAYQPGRYQNLVILAAGTGITPFVGLLDTILGPDSKDACIITLLTFNKTKEDILMKDTLVDASECNPQQLKVVHILSQPTDGTAAPKGRFSPDHISEFLPPPGESTHVLVCGPPAFNTHCKALLQAASYMPSMITVLEK